MKKLKFKDFVTKIDDTFSGYLLSENRLRYGQVVMNVLHDVWPEKYNEISGSDYDCFYDTFLVGYTLNKLEKEWT